MSKSVQPTSTVSNVNAYELLNVSVREYLAYLNVNGYIVPDFQRPEVWTKADNELLLTTIKLGEPMPTFILGECTDGGRFIIDGQQRTRTFEHLLDLFKALPSTLEAIENYVVTVQLVSGSRDELQALFTRVNAKSGLTSCQKIEPQFRGEVAQIKNAIKFSKEIRMLFTKVSKGTVADMKIEVAVSGKVSDASVFLTQAEIMPSYATTSTTEITKTLIGNVSTGNVQKHIDAIPAKLDTLFQVLSNETIAKGIKANMAYVVAVYVLSTRYNADQITDGLLSMFTDDGKDRKFIKDKDIIIVDRDGGKVKFSRDTEMLFGKGCGTDREATQMKIAFIENRIKDTIVKPTQAVKGQLSEDEMEIINGAK